MHMNIAPFLETSLGAPGKYPLFLPPSVGLFTRERDVDGYPDISHHFGASLVPRPHSLGSGLKLKHDYLSQTCVQLDSYSVNRVKYL